MGGISLENAEAGGVEKLLAQDGMGSGILIHSFTKKVELGLRAKTKLNILRERGS